MQTNRCDRADTVVVLDFETTGLSPDRGDRAIEIGAVRLEGGSIRDRFQCLMNPGRRISPFIEQYTGISNAMLKTALPCEEAMAACRDFIGDHDLVAHNASFDRRFLDAELQRISRPRRGAFACSMLAARRLYPDAPNHKLGTLVAYRRLPHDGTFHRALADAEMTAHLWLGMLGDLMEGYHLEPVSFAMMRDLTRLPRGSVRPFLQAHAQAAR
jgi:DNA polymerase-3 subunit epsilon